MSDPSPPRPRAPKGAAAAEAARAGAAAVDAYLAALPDPQRVALGDLRRQIRALVPSATEAISYGVPAFRHHGVLVTYAAFPNHCGFYPMSPPVMDAHAALVAPYREGKATLHFTPEAPLPEDVVAALVRARVAENEALRGPGKAKRG